MIRRVEVAERASIVLALTGYAEALRVAPGGLIPRHMSAPDEIARVTRLVDEFTNKFLYLSDKLLDMSGQELKLVRDVQDDGMTQNPLTDPAELRTLDSDIAEDR